MLVPGYNGSGRPWEMKTMQIELPEKLQGELSALVQNGWFRSEDEVVRVAVTEFLRRARVDLVEKQQREDIAWAVRPRLNESSGQAGTQEASRQP